MKCPKCGNEGTSIGFGYTLAADLYMNVWFDESGNTSETELQESNEEKLILVECGKCGFESLPGVFDNDYTLHKLEKDERGYYIPNYEVSLGPFRFVGKAYIADEQAREYMEIVQAKTTELEALPEALTSKSPVVRNVARRRFFKEVITNGGVE
jgi:hypothetical protein